MLVEIVTVEANDAVPPRLLRHVQRVVGSFDERITILDSGMRPGRDTTAHGSLQRPPLERERVRLYCFTRALGEGNGRVEHGPRQEQHELLATVPADTVDLARLRFQDARELS